MIISFPCVFRFGSCGSLNPDEEIGSFCVADTALLVTRNVDAIVDENSVEPCYNISKPCLPSQDLTDMLKRCISDAGILLHSGMNATTDSFYCSQGRLTDVFIDHNDDLMTNLRENYNVRTFDMETFQLFHLAQCAKLDTQRPIKAACVKMIFANRPKDLFIICDKTKKELEKTGGLFCLKALKSVEL